MEIYFGVEMGGWTHSPALTQGRTAMEFMSFLLAMLLTRQEGKNKIKKKKKKKEKRERDREPANACSSPGRLRAIRVMEEPPDASVMKRSRTSSKPRIYPPIEWVRST